MNPLDVLSPEIVDLCTAIGLVHATGDGPAFDSDWFGDPGPRVARALADDGRRAALVRFVEAVRRGGQGGGGREGDGAGVTLLTVFDAGELGGPPLRLSVALDDRPTEYVEVGLAVSYAADLPTGATVVCALGTLPLLALALRRLVRA